MSDAEVLRKTMWVVLGGCGEYEEYYRWILCACASVEAAQRISDEANAESTALGRATRQLHPRSTEYHKLCETRTIDRTDTGLMRLGDYWIVEVEVRP